ncbi:MAG: zinc ABC transporter substrate-binding protein [Candidatus Omnitrophica bacterium]|nr:zinc ABC transporter substrate-binding protein [Candidatus Omnitrophota bacterium]
MTAILRYLAAAGIVLLGPAVSAHAKPIKVVATLSTFADLVKTIGGDGVEVFSIASPKFNPHFIEPKPSDVVKVKKAALFVHGGLDLELWRGPLLDAAGNTKVFPGQEGELALSQGIELLEVPQGPVSRAQGDIHLYGNPHYWTDPENGKRMAQTICDKLCAIDPDHEEAYQQNLKAFLDRLDQKIPEWRSRLTPYRGRELIGDHRAWPYLMHFLGLQMEHHLEPKPGIPPTPKQVEFLEGYIAERHIPAIVRAAYFPQGAAESLAKRTGARVLLLCQNVGELPECKDYQSMIDYNVQQLAATLE